MADWVNDATRYETLKSLWASLELVLKPSVVGQAGFMRAVLPLLLSHHYCHQGYPGRLVGLPKELMHC